MSFGHSTVPDTLASRLDARAKLLLLVAYIVVIFNVSGWVALGICAAVAIVCCAAARLRPRAVVRALVPLATILAFTVFMQLWYWQDTGTPIAWAGPFTLTVEALNSSAVMIATLCCVMAVSIAFMACTPTRKLVQAFAWLLTPFDRLGFRTEGLVFALNVAFTFLPVLVREFRSVKLAQQARFADFNGDVRGRLAAYRRVFAPLLRNSMHRADRLAEAAISRAWGSSAPSSSRR